MCVDWLCRELVVVVMKETKRTDDFYDEDREPSKKDDRAMRN